jgi:hypothetical protein
MKKMRILLHITLMILVMSTSLMATDYALDFDGSNDYVNCGSNETLDIGDPISLQVWYYLDDKTSCHFIQKGSLSDGYTLRVDSNDGGATADLGTSVGNTWSRTSTSIEISGWHHYIATDDGTNLKQYYDGVLIKTASSSQDINYDNYFMIGANTSGSGNNVNGKIDEVAIWNDALDTDAVTALYNSGSGLDASSNAGDYDEYADNLQGYWKFNEGSGSTTEDVSNNSNTGTLGTSTAGDDAEPSWVVSGLSLVLPLPSDYSGGSGTSEDPYQIADKDDLQYLSENSEEWSKHFQQTANLNLLDSDFETGGIFYNSANGFISIGDGTTQFTGSYDGDGHIIDNLYINRNASYVGLFGYINSAEIQNLGLTDVNITGTQYTGGLVGENYLATVSSCFIALVL